MKHYDEKLTNVSVDFKSAGKCEIHGQAKASVHTKNKVEFSLECDQTYIEPNIKAQKALFNELAKIQGFYDFPY